MHVHVWHTPEWTPTGFALESHVLLAGSALGAPRPSGTAVPMGLGVLLCSEMLAWAAQPRKRLLRKGHGEGCEHGGTCGNSLPFPQTVVMFYGYWVYRLLVPGKSRGKCWASCDGRCAQAKPKEGICRPRQSTSAFSLLSVAGIRLYF